MPVELVLDSKHLKIAPGSVYRAVITIACLFWSSEAGLDGFDESAAAMISKIPAGHWSAIKTPVMTALADILPKLQHERAVAQGKRDNMRDILAERAAKGRLVMQRRRVSQKEQAPPVAPRIPATLPRINNPASATSPAGMVRIGQRVEGDENRLSDV